MIILILTSESQDDRMNEPFDANPKSLHKRVYLIYEGR